MKKFKDLSISRKLNNSFFRILAVLLVVGGMGIWGMQRISQMDTHLYEDQTAPIEHLIKASNSLNQIRIDARGAAIYAGYTDTIQNLQKNYLSSKKTFLSESELYRKSLSTTKGIALYNEASKLFSDTFDPAIQSVFQMAQAGNRNGADAAGAAVTKKAEKLFDNYDQLIQLRMASAKSTSDTNRFTAVVSTVILVVLVILGGVYAVLSSRKTSRAISKPIEDVVSAAHRIAQGRLDVDLSHIDSKDETGQLAAAFTEMLEGIRGQVLAADAVSRGDFTQEVPLRSDEDTLGIALQRIEKELSATLLQIREAAEQVDLGAEQISVGAQSLASGATEQASSVEELNTTITEVAAQVKENAANAAQASRLSRSAQEATVQGDVKMKDMMASIREINEASSDISKIVKAIDNIAFQTNILALNAAVEAARAGEAGKGFAVVAEEVRNLAAKSAEAAKETTALIESSTLKAEAGTKAVDEAAAILGTVSDSVRDTAAFLEKIASASTEQASAISQINQGIGQVSAVVQTNSATAEESAASSEELSGQAKVLMRMVSTFRLRDAQAPDRTEQA